MDCAVIPLARHKGFSLVQTVDFFYPLVDDPHIMGQIALANVVSDIYAVGVTDIDKVDMLVSAPTELTDKQRDIIVPMIIEGFRESAKLAGCRSSQIRSIVVNPWCMIGGVASSVCTAAEIIMPSNAQAGDLLILTKPLGTQLATNAYLWSQEKNEKYSKLITFFTDEDIKSTFDMAIKSMTYLNKNAGLLMHKYGAHAATDVTGFGLLGHAKNLVDFQKRTLLFQINKLPVLRNVLAFGELVSHIAKLRSGCAVETSGGLLIALPAANAKAFCSEFKKLTNGAQRAYIIGEVLAAEVSDAKLSPTPEFIEVTL